MPIQTIVTHPGGAHKDDFLACCILVHEHQAPIERREPSESDLSSSSICVVDVGGSHEPALNNFDHHQFPADHPPCCALSLVMQNMGIYEDAQLFCNWLRPAEWLDTRGPVDTAKELGIDRDVFNALLSPIDITLLRRFACETEVTPENPIYQVMKMIGEDLVSYIRSLRSRLDYLGQVCQRWTVESDRGTVEAVFLPRKESDEEEPSFGLFQYVKSLDDSQSIVAMVCPDRRGNGYGLSRFEDNPKVDFTKIEHHDDVRFAHKRGFVAKTESNDIERLKVLLAEAIV
jgi:hypothetical protein